MSDKNVKKLSRRLLSGFRKGKKLNAIKEHNTGEESVLENTLNLSQEDADLTEYPTESQTCGLDASSSAQSPTRRFLHRKKSSVTSLKASNDNSDLLQSIASPRRIRFPQAGQISKSSSTDSGIDSLDCSVLLPSDVGSPEQLVAFRKEAERLRLERKQIQNEPVLETLTEVDRSSGEEGDVQVGDGNTNVPESASVSVGKLEPVNILSKLNSDSCEMTSALKETESVVTNVEATCRQKEESVLKTERHNQSTVDKSSVTTDLVPMSLKSDSNSNGLTKHLDQSKLDQSKYKEKSKSIKRSVSDVGKGILGHFRHKRKGNESFFNKEDSFFHNHSKVAHDTKKFLHSKFKRISMRKKKKSKDIDGSVNIVDLPSLSSIPGSSVDARLSADSASVDTDCVTQKTDKHIKKKGRKQSGSKSEKGSSSSKKDKYLHQRESPVFHESLHDLTNSICEMTDALRVGSSSAESLPCICDCEKKKVNCCERRRTPPDGAFSSDLEVAPEHHSRVLEVCSAPDDNDFDGDSTLDASCAANTTTSSELRQPKMMSQKRSTSEGRISALEPDFDLTDCDTTTDDTDDSEWDGECSCEESCLCYMEECSDPDCRECRYPDSVSEDSDCDNNNVKETHDNPPVCSRKLINVDKTETENKTSSSSTLPSSEKQSSPEEDLSFNLDNSFSVSFKEIDFENGDVMYVEDCDSLFPFTSAEECNKVMNPGFTAMNETPDSSPQISCTDSVDTTPTPLNLSDHSSFTNISFEETKKKDGENSSPRTQLQNLNTTVSQTYSKSNIKRTNLNESKLNGSYTHLINNASKPVAAQPQSCLAKKQCVALNTSRVVPGVLNEGSAQFKPFSNPAYSQPSAISDCKPYFKKPTSGLGDRLNKSFNTFDELENRHFWQPSTSKDCLNKTYSHDGRRQQILLNRSMPEMDSCEAYFGHSFKADNSLLESCSEKPASSSAGHSVFSDSNKLNQTLTVPNCMDTDIKSSLNLSVSEEFNFRIPSGSKINFNQSMVDLKQRELCPPGKESALNSTFPNIRPQYGNPNMSLNCSQLTTASPGTPPLDLSMSKQQVDERKARIANRSRKWLNRHIGQVYSPAKRVLHKNRGLSESDLCKQILDLYVSDADESGYEPGTGTDTSFDTSVLPDRRFNVEDSILQYGTYVAPRNFTRETNVDDFTTTTVQTCYSGEARTRKLQSGHGNAVSLRGEDRRRAAEEEMKRLERSFGRPLDTNKPARRKSLNTSMNSSMHEDSFPLDDTDEEVVAGHARFSKIKPTSGRSALKDRTNTSSSPLASSERIVKSKKKPVLKVHQQENKQKSLSERSFDQLTMLHTVHNGQRKVRCLTMEESMSAIKDYPPPKEATRISWGQTLDEMDLYRHTPRRTPIKTRPILMMKDKDFPYDDDTPSPIVLTKMRKPKSFARKYKNWPWS